jgi:uncharacterized membrane protein YoaK (UPF0700 family)
MIHLESVTEVYNKKNVIFWILSAFKAGFINSAGFLLTGKFVSHVTGFGTQVGVAVGHKDFFFGIELLIIPISFIFGGVVTSFVLDRKYENNESPPYFIIQGLITLLIAFVILFWELQMNASQTLFDSDNTYDFNEFLVIGLLCFICGLKNSLVTWTTFGKIRVTHLTGLSTDIGLNILRLFKKDFYSPRFQESRLVNIIRLLTFAFFSIGAFLSAAFFTQLNHFVFMIVLAISAVMTVISVMDWRSRMIKSPVTEQLQS